MSAGLESSRPVRMLFVCTANRVRSPFAEAVARRIAAEHNLPIEVASAGLSEGGRPTVPEMVEVAGSLGVDLAPHLSRRVDESMISTSDLVVAMTGGHVVDLVGLDPAAARRVVTLRELAAAGPEGRPPPWEPGRVRSWADAVAARPIGVVLSGDLDVADPIGGPRRAYRRTAEEITALLEQALTPAGTGPG